MTLLFLAIECYVVICNSYRGKDIYGENEANAQSGVKWNDTIYHLNLYFYC